MTEDSVAPGRSQSGLWFSVLGPLEARFGGTPLALGGAKQQMVLALLLCEANRVVPTERLISWVWGENDDSGRHSGTLQVYMSNLRRALTEAAEQLGRPIIITRRPGYIIELADDELDLLRFNTLRRSAEEAQRLGRPGQAAQELRAALALWRGEPLSGLPIDVTDSGVVSTLTMQQTTVIEQTVEAELGVGRHREVLAELQAWVKQHPLDERLRAHLMIALYRCGRQADALATFREARELLVEELGIDPSRELRELEEQILNQDPALDLVGPARPLAAGEATELRSSIIPVAAVLEFRDRVVPIESSLVTIGRLEDRNVQLDDTRVSRVHAEIRRSGGEYRLVDAGSANGTLVNGARVTEQILRDGDTIEMGDTTVVFRIPTP